MTVTDMREALKRRYSPVIRNQSVDYMPENQVIAIYHSLIERKDAEVTERKVPKKMRLHEPMKYEQMRMEI